MSTPPPPHTHTHNTCTVTDIDVLPLCDFKPAYAQKRRVKKYNGVYQVHESRVYPKDETWFHNWHKKNNGNPEISKEVRD